MKVDSTVKVNVRNVGDSKRVFYHYGNRIELEPNESVNLIGDVGCEVKSNVAFDVGTAFEDKKPTKKKKMVVD